MSGQAPGKGKRVALASAAAALIAAGAAMVALKQPVTEWWYLRELASKDPAEKEAAARELVRMGSVEGVRRILPLVGRHKFSADLLKADEGAPALIEILRDEKEDDEIRGLALRGLVYRPILDSNSVHVLVDALKDDSEEIQLGAARALNYHRIVGRDDSIGALALVDAFKGSSSVVREEIAKLFGRVGAGARDAVPLLLSELEISVKRQEELRLNPNELLRALGSIGAPSVPAIMGRLSTADESMARRLRSAFEGMDASAVPALLPYLDDADGQRRMDTADALGLLGEDAREAVPALLERLADENVFVRRAAMASLVAIERHDEPVVAAFTQGLGNEDWRIRASAARGLGNAGTKAVHAFSKLAQLAFDEQADVRLRAVEALLKLGAPPEDLVRICGKVLLADDDRRPRKVAVKALAKMGAPAVPALAEALHARDPSARMQAAVALGQVGQAAAPAIPALIEALRDEDQDVAFQAMSILGGLGPLAKDAAAVIAELLLRDEAPAARMRAASALGLIGPEARAALPALQKVLADRSPLARAAAGRAIERITGQKMQETAEHD